MMIMMNIFWDYLLVSMVVDGFVDPSVVEDSQVVLDIFEDIDTVVEVQAFLVVQEVDSLAVDLEHFLEDKVIVLVMCLPK